MASSNDDLWNSAFSSALEGIASGLDYDEVRGYLFDNYPSLGVDDIDSALAQALKDALVPASGIDRDDIGEGWLTR